MSEAPRAEASAVEGALAALPEVADAAVLCRPAGDGPPARVAYVVPAADFRPERLADRLPPALQPDAWVPIAALPLRPDGEVDAGALRRTEVIDRELIARVERGFAALPGVGEVAAVVREIAPPRSFLHLSDLLPDWRSAAAAAPVSTAVSAPPAAAGATPPAVACGPPLVADPGAPRVLAEVLERAAGLGESGIIFLDDQGEEHWQSYAELLAAAERIAGGLDRQGLRPGDRVILQLECNRDFVAAFWGAIVGGYLPVPLAVAPDYHPENTGVRKLHNAWQLLEQPFVLTDGGLREAIRALAGPLRMPGLRVGSIEALRAAAPNRRRRCRRPDEVAVILLSSGSTGMPKGIEQSHRRLLDWVAGTIRHNRFRRDDVLLSWTPLEHVGGLLFAHLRSVVTGARQVLVPTAAILGDPLKWLDLIERYRVRTTWASNFAFALVNERLAESPERRWDLSSVRLITSAGEMIVPRTARRFLELLAPHSLAPAALQPAWGLSETCCGVTYSHRFSLAATADDDRFVEVGSLIPGHQLRIVLESGAIAPEGVIGGVEVRGPSVTDRYLGNPEATRKAFLGDGWMRTGDLGFLRAGQLTITGRRQGLIIINGVNYFSHEFEAVADEVDGVVGSYTAACAVRSARSDSDELAVVFHPRADDDQTLRRILADVRRALTQRSGVSPAHLIPLPAAAVPKTPLGKIRHQLLGRRFHDGDYDAIRKRVDLLVGNRNTLPAWFFRRVWRRRSRRPAEGPVGSGARLVFADGQGLGEAICAARPADSTVWVEAADRFERTGPGRYRIDPGEPEHYRRLIAAVSAEGAGVGEVLHLWSYEIERSEPAGPQALVDAQVAGLFSLIFLFQALKACPEIPLIRVARANDAGGGVPPDVPSSASGLGGREVCPCLPGQKPPLGKGARGFPATLSGREVFLTVVSSRAQAVSAAPHDYWKAPLLGLLPSLAQELPSFRVRHLDLAGEDPTAEAALVAAELTTACSEPEVVLRGSQRLVPRLERFTPMTGADRSPGFRRGGFYLLSGGLGGIGLEIARFLVERFDAHLLLVGRTQEQALAGGGAVHYEAVDIADGARLEALVAEREEIWQRPLDGILHLDGLTEETRAGVEEILGPKVAGTWWLGRLLERREAAWMMSFSSVVAYAAGNRFQEAFAQHHHRAGKRCYCTSWNDWENLGGDGIASLRAALAGGEPHLLIGPDARSSAIRRHLDREEPRLRELAVCFTGADVDPPAFTDRFGTAVTLTAVRLDELPRTAGGAIDRQALRWQLDEDRETSHVGPRTPLEEQLAAIWKELLGLQRVGVHDNFFALGGHSLLATRVVSAIRKELEVEIPLSLLFEEPTLSGLASHLEIPSGWQGQTAPAIKEFALVCPGTEPPLSFAQQRLWFLDQFESGNPAYNLISAMRLEGRLEPAALERSCREIVRRHQVLRTSFPSVDGEPRQLVAARVDLRLPRIDLTRPRPPLRAAQELIRRLAARPFDLARGPLLRLALLRLDRRDHILVVALHHIVSDGWSQEIFQRELTSLYQAFSAGRPSPLEELEIQYADFAVWQRRWLRGERLATQLAWWREQFADEVPVLELPGDRPRPAIRRYGGAARTVEFDPRLTEALRRLGHEAEGSLFMTLLAAFMTLLFRLTGQRDVVVGSPIANRGRREIEPLVGFFVNTLALRAKLVADHDFRRLLHRVRATALAAFNHQDLPFERLVEELRPERDPSRNPLFEVVFALNAAPPPRVELPELALTPLDFDVLAGAATTVRFDLELHLWEVADGLRGIMAYRTDLFDASTIARLAKHFGRLLQGIADGPQRRVGELPLLSDAERHQLAAEWNDTRARLPSEHGLHRLFEAQVRRRPEAIALTFDANLSYRELDRRANRLAHHLRRRGVGTETLVGVCLEPSVDLVTSELAVLKAGGAYLPLDPAWPSERLAQIRRETGMAVVLTRAASPPGVAGVRPDDPAIRGESDESPPGPTRGDQLAYVMVTSGSTGVPKGVAVTHRAVVRLLVNTNYIRLRPADRLGQLANVAFDAATFEVWGALVHGGLLTGVPRAAALDPRALAAELRRREIGVIFLTAALYNQVIDEDPAAFRTLRCLLVGGEALSPERIRQALAEGAPQRLLNGYGPTETTTFAAWHRVRRVPPGARTVPLGRPISNTELHVVDPRLRRVPVGVEGELAIAGPGLARGYLRQPAWTAEHFVPHPSGDRGERLYRTGDRVRQDPDGTIEFLGRFDHQVKLRGFRIELGEIEKVLASHPAVRAAVVMVRAAPGEVADRRLVTWVVPCRDAADPTAAELSAFLRGKLPDYMVPGAFEVVPKLPLSRTGKVDRAALSRRPLSASAAPLGRSALRTPIEEMIAGIFGQVLGVGNAGADDNFFALGGHSLRATQVVSRIRRTFDVEVGLSTLFEAPTVAELARRVAEALRAGRTLPLPPIVARTEEAASEGLPLSFAQQRLWFMDQRNPGSAAYNIPSVLRLRGILHFEALRRAFAEIVRRHAVLRTTFVHRGGQPRQLVHSVHSVHSVHPGWPLPVADLRRLPEAEREAELRRLARAEAARPFDLSQGPLLRTTILRLGTHDHTLLHTMHHVASDGWSMGILVGELAAFYRAFAAAAAAAPLPELPVTYADFASWQRQWLRGEVLETELAYWRRQLAGAPTLELATDRPRPPVQTSRGAHLDFALAQELGERLEQLSLEHHTTLYMTLLAAFKVLLHRMTGQRDLSVGTPIANRTHPEIEPLIGFFVNTLVLRTAVPNLRFTELLGRVREVALQAYAHQNLPFERLVEALEVERDPSRTPLFQVMFALQNAPAETFELPDLTIEPMAVETGTTPFDLTLTFDREAGGLHCPVAYNTDLFDETTIRRMVHHLARLLAAIAADPAGPLRELPILSESERHQLHREWNDDAASYPREASIPQLVEARAARAPEAIALSFGDRHLSYGELDRRSRRLAQHLAGHGVGPEIRVGVCTERCPAMVISLLAVLKAGAAYVPLNPDDPSERLTHMLGDAGVALLLTQEALLDRLPAGGWQPLLIEELLRKPPRIDAAPRVRADNLAYVMYTSGSTGRPKGVGITHRAIVRLLLRTNYIRLRPSDRVAQLASITFDAATFEIWGALLSGARLVGFSRATAMVPHELASELRRRDVSVALLITALFHQLLGEEPAALGSLRCVLFGGEAINPERVSRALAEGAPDELLHVYGPSEATTLASWHRVRGLARGARTVAIGRPLANTELHVVDAGLGSVPMGGVGELLIGGDGLARGYVNQPARTAERFVPHPFGGPGERLYRTGDGVRLPADGMIEFLGRFDHQVKLRGFRIELGEIEAVLGRHPAVREAVVILRDPEPGGEAVGDDDKQLVAYVVPRGEEDPVTAALNAGELRAFLRDALPEFMVPGAFVIVTDLPLAATGKVDRAALGRRALPASGTPYADASAAPRTPVEEILAGIFAQVLGIGSVDVDDDFFALGGHSLRATRVIAWVRKAFGVELGVGTVFESPTVAKLAACVVEAQHAGQTAKAPPLVARERLEASEGAGLPLSFAQQRLWFLNRMQPESTAYNMPLALRLRGELGVGTLRRVFEEVVRRHAVLRTTFVTREGEPRQLIHPPPRWPLPVIDLRRLPEARRELEMRRRAGAEARQPFDLARDPLLRTAILRLGPRQHVLLLTMHHIAADGWSTGVLVGEIGALYPVFAAGRRSPLPELEVEYVDFALWQRQWFRGAVLEAELAYWRQQLAGVPVPALPTDRPRPPVQRARGAHLGHALPARLSQGLERLSLAEDATLFMTLLAAFKVWLHRITRQRDLAVGTPIANRTQAELEPLIGFFDNTLVLRTRLAAGRFTELLERVREVALQAYVHQNLPFEGLVEALDVVRDPSRSPLFQVMFALQNTPAGSLELPDLALEPVIVETGTSTFDLTLSFSREPQGLTYLVEYNTDLFDGTTIRRMSRQLAHLLEGIVADPGRRLGELPLLSEAEGHQLRVEWNDRSAVRHREPSIVERFEARVEGRPEAVAVVFEHARLTYRELNRRANRLAHHLRDLGVGPEVRVGIALRRSLEMIVAVLGILKAGGAYVPLDPSHPPGRLAWQLEDAGASVVLVRSPSTDPIPTSSAHRVYLAEQPFEPRDDDPGGTRPPASTAYVLFTSGSTGRPKGVSVTHENLAHSTAARIGTYGEAGSLLLLPSLAFDASVGGLYWTLSSGGMLWLIPEEELGDPAKLGSLIARGRISRLLSVASFYSTLLGEVPPRDLASLRAVIVGGDACSPELAARHRALLPRTALYHEYGLTEAAVWSTVHRCESAAATVPIGRPIAGTQLLILDPYGNPVPIGVPGELAIGGVGVARGYLGRPQLSAERWAPSPFAEAPGSRLCRTGDLGRHLPEHAVEFLGRIDREVKIRGFRVEPGEIEAVLAEHPGLREAAVVAWDDGPGERRLVAYAVATVPISTTELRRFLRERLPEHMVPARFVLLDALPRTPAGKLDRRALPAPQSSRPQLETARVAPRTGIERAIAEVWREVLGLDEVGVDDNFFELGGQSFAIIKVKAGLRKRLDRDLPVSDLFMYPTIRSLAQHLSEGEVPETPSESPSSPAEGRIARRDALRRQRQRRQRHRTAD